MKTAVSKVPNSIFVAIVPGLFERSGRGLPYILPRDVRAEIAVSVGADIVVEELIRLFVFRLVIMRAEGGIINSRGR